MTVYYVITGDTILITQWYWTSYWMYWILLLAQRKMSTIYGARWNESTLPQSTWRSAGWKPILALVLYDEINPLHLPEVLSLIGQHQGQGELYVALKSSIAGVISTVNRKECFRQRRAYLVAELAELDAELEAINESERDVVGVESGESRSSKRRRKWWGNIGIDKSEKRFSRVTNSC